jgi:hypothetical protein
MGTRLMDRVTWSQLVNSKDTTVKQGNIVVLTEFVEAASLNGLASSSPLEWSGSVRLGLQKTVRGCRLRDSIGNKNGCMHQQPIYIKV